MIKQVSKMFGKITEHYDSWHTPSAEQWIARILPGETIQDTGLVRRTRVGGAARFVAKEKLHSATETDGVSIAWLGPNFRRYFHEKVEKDVTDADLMIFQLSKNLREDLDITKFLNEELTEIYLAHLWSLLRAQGHGEEGVLLARGGGAISRIRDTGGCPRPVLALYDPVHHGWCIEANAD